MRRYLNYLMYVLIHKFYVFIACCKFGIPFRGITHDLSKFLPSEFIPYAKHFYNEDGSKTVRDKTGYYKPTDNGDPDFDHAWFLHQKRNKHHWQWWVMPEDTAGVKVLPMDITTVKEMVADWVGAGKAKKSTGVHDWYAANKDKLQLHPTTKELVELFLSHIN